jgi:hypothetical protein
MAIYNVSNDVQTVRFDTGSLFGGVYDRDGMDDAAILKLVTLPGDTKPSLVQTNAVYNEFQGTETARHDYRIVHTGDISVRTRWDNIANNDGSLADLGNTFSTGESATADYKLDWGKAKFSSIKFQLPSYGATYNTSTKDYSSWTTVIEVSSTDSVLDLPFRANETDSTWVATYREKYKDATTGTTTNTQKYNAAFEYQSVIYNWQWVFGYSSAQYLFGNDNIIGTRNDDVLRGFAGDDKVRGGSGDDLLYADYGSDQLFGGPGDDVLVFGGSSSSWDVKNFEYRSSPIELAVGGSGADMFVFRPSEITWTNKEIYNYEMSLPNLYNGKFRYKKILDAEQDAGYFRANATGDIVTVDSAGKEIVVRKAAFSANDNPFPKYQQIVVTESDGNLVTTGFASNPLSPITIGAGTTAGKAFFVDSTGAVFSQVTSTQNSPFIQVKAAVFTATNNPFLKTKGLNVTVDANGDIVTQGLAVNTFVKSGQDVVFDERIYDDNGVVDLTVRGYDNDGNLYVRNTSDNWHYNPFMSQSQNDAYHSGTTGATRATTDVANGLSNLTQRIKVQDFKIGSDKIDLSAFGLSREVLLANDKTLTGKNGTTYLKALSDVLKTEGLKITSAKNGWTSGNTSLFLKEDAADFNGNGTKDDTLLEIQLVGINISSLNGRFFGESVRTTESDY